MFSKIGYHVIKKFVACLLGEKTIKMARKPGKKQKEHNALEKVNR